MEHLNQSQPNPGPRPAESLCTEISRVLAFSQHKQYSASFHSHFVTTLTSDALQVVAIVQYLAHAVFLGAPELLMSEAITTLRGSRYRPKICASSLKHFTIGRPKQCFPNLRLKPLVRSCAKGVIVIGNGPRLFLRQRRHLAFPILIFVASNQQIPIQFKTTV